MRMRVMQSSCECGEVIDVCWQMPTSNPGTYAVQFVHLRQECEYFKEHLKEWDFVRSVLERGNWAREAK